jgi:hypothetical protein
LRPALLSQNNTAKGGGNSADNRDDAQLSFAERAHKRQHVQDKSEGSEYINTRFLLPTSCVVERLFSHAKRVFSPHQRRLNIKTLEALLLLNQDRQLWNLFTASSVENERDEAESDEEQDDEAKDDQEDQVWCSSQKS